MPQQVAMEGANDWGTPVSSDLSPTVPGFSLCTRLPTSLTRCPLFYPSLSPQSNQQLNNLTLSHQPQVHVNNVSSNISLVDFEKTQAETPSPADAGGKHRVRGALARAGASLLNMEVVLPIASRDGSGLGICGTSRHPSIHV